MANTTQDGIYNTFLQVSGQQTSALSDASTSLAEVLAQVQELRSATPEPNVKTTSSQATESPSAVDTLTSVASTVLKSGFGLAPLVSGLAGLFGGSDTPAPAPLVKYAMPAAVDFQGAETASGTSGFDYDQSGMPRAYRPGPPAASPATFPATSQAADGTSASAAAPAPQITVNVQAMDARSFLDRSNDIALAVRDAMLNMNAINDVVNEL